MRSPRSRVPKTRATRTDIACGSGGHKPPDDEPPDNFFDMPIEPIVLGPPLRDALLMRLSDSKNDTKKDEGSVQRPDNLSLR